MTKRGRPPRTDDRRSEKVRVSVTQEELARILATLNTDERRQALLATVIAFEAIAKAAKKPCVASGNCALHESV